MQEGLSREENVTRLDEIDRKILKILQADCRRTLEEMSKELGIPKSTIHYRVKRLEEKGVIEGCYAKLNYTKLGKDFVNITLIRAKYGERYHERLGKLLAQIPGVKAVYFILGQEDFLVISRTGGRREFLKVLENMMSLKDIERTSTLTVAKIYKEDPTLDLD